MRILTHIEQASMLQCIKERYFVVNNCEEIIAELQKYKNVRICSNKNGEVDLFITRETVTRLTPRLLYCLEDQLYFASRSYRECIKKFYYKTMVNFYSALLKKACFRQEQTEVEFLGTSLDWVSSSQWHRQ